MMHKAWCGLGEVPYCFTRTSVKFQGHTAKKIGDFDPNWVFPDSNSSLNSLMVMHWCTKFVVVCQISRSYGTKNPRILTRIERVRTVTPVWIHWWLWNVAQSFRSHRPENRWFESNFKEDYSAGRSYQIPQICLVYCKVMADWRWHWRHGSRSEVVTCEVIADWPWYWRYGSRSKVITHNKAFHISQWSFVPNMKKICCAVGARADAMDHGVETAGWVIFISKPWFNDLEHTPLRKWSFLQNLQRTHSELYVLCHILAVSLQSHGMTLKIQA